MKRSAHSLDVLLRLGFCLAWSSIPVALAQAQVTELHGDQVITSAVVWKNSHVVIHGNLVIETSGSLRLENSTVEVAGAYSRQYSWRLAGGSLSTINSTVGGTKTNGVICHTNILVERGDWESTDTTVQYLYGINFTGNLGGRLRATRLIQGENPDALLMNGRGDAIIRDSTYNIALNASAASGGSMTLDLPVNQSMTRVFDGSNTTGARYRLELINCRVPNWFFFLGGISMTGPPMQVTLARCPKLIPSIMGANLTGSMHLPAPWNTLGGMDSFITGNVTWEKNQGIDPIATWGVYLSGANTSLTLTGPTNICELMLRAGKASLAGTAGTYDAKCSATTTDAGPGTGVELSMRNALIGPGVGGSVRGQVTANDGSRVLVDHAKLSNLKLITEGTGSITINDYLVQEGGSLVKLQNGGPIVLTNPQPTPTPTPKPVAIDGQFSMVTSVKPSATKRTAPLWNGMWFTVGSRPLIVRQLGRYYLENNKEQHMVRVIRMRDMAVVAAAIADMSAGTPDALGFKYGYSWEAVLEPNERYYILCKDQTDAWYDYDTRVTARPEISLGGLCWSADLETMNSSPSAGRCYGPVNMKYDLLPQSGVAGWKLYHHSFKALDNRSPRGPGNA